MIEIPEDEGREQEDAVRLLGDTGSSEKSNAGPGSFEPPSVPLPQRIIEALLFVGGTPLSEDRVLSAIRGLTSGQLQEAIDTLDQAYRRQGRPYTIQRHQGGYLLTLRDRYRSVLERVYGSTREAKLSAPAIDVLSLVAYRQPVTKQEIDSIRGMDSGALLRQLVRRGLVTVAQRAEKGSRAVSYGTTQRFLELFKLKSLDDLPQTQDLQKL